MKSFFTTTSAVVLATSISLSAHSTTEAFTTPQHSQIQYVRSSSSSTTILPSTLVSDTDMIDTTTTTTQAEQLLTEGYEYEVQNTDEVATQKKYLEDGFVFGLESSGLERPKGKNANVVVEGDSLETTPKQIAIVSATFAGHALIAANAINTLLENTDGNVELTAATSLATIVSSWILADLGSGIFHWSVDNYGNGSTPVMGNIIAAFQGHHSAQWTITYRGFCNNVWKLCIPFGVPTAGALALLGGEHHPMVGLFFAVFCSIEILSQEFHKWSHMTKKEAGPIINTLQNLGISIGRVSHAKHHIAPYDGNYCIVSGLCNPALDNSGFLRWLEHRVYESNGVEANSWKLDPELRERTLRGEYRLSESA